MDSARIVATVIFVGSLVLLGDAWLKENQENTVTNPAPITAEEAASSVPLPTVKEVNKAQSSPELSVPSPRANKEMQQIVTIKTDLLNVLIDLKGAGIKELTLLEHHAKENKDNPLRLFESGVGRTYVAETGLIGDKLPTHNEIFTSSQSDYSLSEGEDSITVIFSHSNDSHYVEKKYSFYRGSYALDVDYKVVNTGPSPLSVNAYFQLIRDGGAADGDTRLQPTYTGAAIYTDESKFTKVDFKDMDRGKVEYPKVANDGWAAFVQHYFVAAWLPDEGASREYFTRALPNNLYAIGFINTETLQLNSGDEGEFSARLYAGPQEQRVLKELAPGFDLVVDYGWLTIIASPLFWLLSKLHNFVGNWGWSIVLLTIIIKLVFFPLSAAGYKSMAKMRVLSPRLKALKETYGDDKQKFQQAMMDLYRKEKINPLGGCFPILVQIPFFIALYWVLLASVELRDAPFIFWITDLSAKDPYYVLPILMSASMVAQSWLSPAPPDPVQAKVMKIMPFVFSIFFFFFASGLVLYWLVNNILSIAQQWTITRAIERNKPTNGQKR